MPSASKPTPTLRARPGDIDSFVADGDRPRHEPRQTPRSRRRPAPRGRRRTEDDGEVDGVQYRADGSVMRRRTIHLQDELNRELNQRVAHEGRKLCAVVQDAIREYLAKPRAA